MSQLMPGCSGNLLRRIPSIHLQRTIDWVAVAALCAGAVFAQALPAQAQGKLQAQYLATIAGIPIGKGSWTIEISEDRYTATVVGGTTGLLRVFASGEGKSTVRGAMVGGAPIAGNFSATISANKGTEEFRLTLDNGDVKDFSVTPPPQPNPERVPVTEVHRRGVNDPMTASLVRVPGNGNVVGPEACRRTLSVFDGRMRYDLQLAYKRIDQMVADKGYTGPVVVCGVKVVPIAGHNPERAAVKYLTNMRDMEVALAPIAGTRVLVPFRVSVPTPIGLGILQATEFVSAASPRATASSAKAQ